ncbi:probable mediator of RNA polymerase II transcription subunit 26b isoform X1 [Phoenix dactylifera]|uniref:Probable mediator of RNA polymerase II transcription subunit 26b isoform X1 n=1 Tax=Phoenix dactylifera TaxID=42345 RepID=A0A8B7CG12_PHODC|nr:probable mediator of RNA polymerase II transcription subunit 26b isoform X1 [Phoenix dactylifera]XP_038988201.1 probable mediator of RNA polymerase II transcription subunit 26b isoform X1 [Phoenix dactylifera]
MANSSASLDYWRKFFRSANSDIFEVLEQAILVAASDYPQEFRSRRDGIGEKLYTCLLPRCSGCDRVESRVSTEGGEEGDGSVKRDVEKESKVDSSNEVFEDLNRLVSSYSYDEAEALTEEIEEESQMFAEVLRIKEILANKHDQSDSVLFDSLRRLQLMELSVETLKATEIGRAVNGLRKHNSKQIRHLVRTLIDGWKVLVDEWVSATAAIADNSPASVNPSVVDEEEEGLPSPPLDEGALWATQTTSIQLSKFFDGMDDDGNLRNNGEFDKNREDGRRLPVNHETVRKQQPPCQPVVTEDRGQMRKQEPVMRQTKPQEASAPQAKPQRILRKESKPLSANSGPGRPAKLPSEQKAVDEMKPKQQDLSSVQRKPPVIPQDKSKYSEEALVRAKLEAAKRKLHEGYQQAENAKKQRTIQVMELHDIPKQSHHHRQPNMKPRNQFRSWANGRH